MMHLKGRWDITRWYGISWIHGHIVLFIHVYLEAPLAYIFGLVVGRLTCLWILHVTCDIRNTYMRAVLVYLVDLVALVEMAL